MENHVDDPYLVAAGEISRIEALCCTLLSVTEIIFCFFEGKMGKGSLLCCQLLFVIRGHQHNPSRSVKTYFRLWVTVKIGKNAELRDTIFFFSQSKILRYLVNNTRLAKNRTTPCQGNFFGGTFGCGTAIRNDHIREEIAVGGVAAIQLAAMQTHHRLKAAQQLQGKADRRLGHVQTGLDGVDQQTGYTPQGRERSSPPTGAPVDIEEIGERSRGQLVVQQLPPNEGVAADPGDPLIAVGVIDQMVLILPIPIAAGLHHVTGGDQFRHCLLGCGRTAMGKSGQHGKGHADGDTLTASHAEIESLLEEIDVVTELTKRCIAENSQTAQNQNEYAARYNGFVERYEKEKAQLAQLRTTKAAREAQADAIGAFMFEVQELNALTEFDEKLWLTIIDTVTVHADGRMAFKFRGGTEIDV